ncbi:putative efflux pump [Hypomontagnella submonticulosa]|nr:putative efflux pump [Hypomontagnella submonticulosa]
MSEPKGPPSFEASSRAPTLAGSNASFTDRSRDEKTPPSRDQPSDSASSVDFDEEPREKIQELAKHSTAHSRNGEPMHQIQTREDGTEYPTGLKLGLITLALCLSVFLMALDNAIIATAIPKITDAFHSLPDVGWYGSAYLLTTAALQLLFGKFYTFLSIKWVYLTAIGIFELGSLICGVAQNSVTLIIGRAVAGMGSAGIMSGALLILAHSVPLARRPMYTGIISSMYGIASVAGPLLGGVFTDKVTWRWCFYINLPIGAVTIFVILFFFPAPHQAKPKDETLVERIKRFDPLGTVLFMPAIICLLLALQWGGVDYPWNNGRIIALFVVFAVLMIAFLYVQHLQQENATVPPRIMKNRTVWASSLFAFGIGSGFFIMVYYIPIWFQTVQGVSAVDSGIRNLPMLISVVVFAMGAGALVTIFGYYAPFMILGTVLMSIGGGLLSTWKPDTATGTWIGYQILFGAGVGMSMQQPLMAVQTVLDIKDVPTGTSVLVFVQTVGGALFVSVGQSVFSNKLVQELAANIPGLDVSSVRSAGATALQNTLPAEMIPKVVLSYSNALTTTFLVGAALAAFTVFGSATIEWKSVKGKNVEAALV